MSHAHHFLSRLDRLNDHQQLEQAKLLYNDSELLQLVLERAKLPPSCERVAISLAHPVDGPWIITTHTGKFVTCLAMGMHPSKTDVRVAPEVFQSVITEHTQIQAYLEAFFRYPSRSGAANAEALLGWVLKRPERVAREDARALAGLAILARASLVNHLSALHAQVCAWEAELSATRKERHRERGRAALNERTLSQAHIFAALFAIADIKEMFPQAQDIAFAMALQLTLQSIPAAVRGLWALQTPDLDVECAAYFEGMDVDCAKHAFTVAVASLIAAKGVDRRERTRRLAKLAQLFVQHDLADVLCSARLALTNPTASVRQAIDAGRTLYMDLAARLDDGHPLRVSRPDIAEQIALTTLYSMGSSQPWATDHLPLLISAMPHFLRAPLEDLYLPASVLNALQGIRVP